MPIKNYTTKVPSNRSIDEIQQSLVKHGASGMIFEYEQGTGRISALRFRLEIKGNQVVFSLPVNWRKFQLVLKKDRVNRWDDEEYVYRVSWRVLRDWVMAQMALYETEIVEMPQIFLPFATGADGSTLYDRVLSGQFLLDKPTNNQ